MLQDQLGPLDLEKCLIEFDEAGVSDTIDYIARFIVSLAGYILLIAPIVALPFIHENRYRLLLVSLYLVAFAFLTSLAAFKLTIQELPTAAYAAVLIVFVSGTPAL